LKSVNIDEAKTHLTELLQEVMNGEEIIIMESGEPVAKLLPIKQAPHRWIPGIDAEKVLIHE